MENKSASRSRGGWLLPASAALLIFNSPYVDVDNDGAPHILIASNGGPAYLFRNIGGNRNHAIQIRTVGTRSNRDGIGA